MSRAARPTSSSSSVVAAAESPAGRHGTGTTRPGRAASLSAGGPLSDRPGMPSGRFFSPGGAAGGAERADTPGRGLGTSLRGSASAVDGFVPGRRLSDADVVPAPHAFGSPLQPAGGAATPSHASDGQGRLGPEPRSAGIASSPGGARAHPTSTGPRITPSPVRHGGPGQNGTPPPSSPLARGSAEGPLSQSSTPSGGGSPGDGQLAGALQSRSSQ